MAASLCGLFRLFPLVPQEGPSVQQNFLGRAKPLQPSGRLFGPLPSMVPGVRLSVPGFGSIASQPSSRRGGEGRQEDHDGRALGAKRLAAAGATGRADEKAEVAGPRDQKGFQRSFHGNLREKIEL